MEPGVVIGRRATRHLAVAQARRDRVDRQPDRRGRGREGQQRRRPPPQGGGQGRHDHRRAARIEVAENFGKDPTSRRLSWSDDVTYAIHDLLDFYRAGLIPLEQIRLIRGTLGPGVERDAFLERVFKRQPGWEPRRTEYEAALDSILDILPFDPLHRYSGTESDEQLLYQFSTELITKYVTAITPDAGGETLVTIPQNARDEVDVLQEFVWAYVIHNPDLAVVQAGQRKAIRTVFTRFLGAARHQQLHFFPVGFRGLVARCASDDRLVRVVADYVAGMTERELIHTYRRLEAMVN
ncbi:MAG: hypothetical protein GEU99_06455 [Luteitalea sp.]|nr:hypothetical protein [Luteitalea sp.]